MSNKMEQGFLELCEWLQKRTKLNSPIAHDTDLIKNKIIVYTRNVGKAKLYKINTELPQIKKLIEN